MNEIAELEIRSIAAGGDGVGRVEGMAVFVPRTAPGDRVRVRLERHQRFARGALLELLAPGPDRVEPPCAHYTADRCGGCQLQHLAYPAQLEAKRAVIRDALVRIGKRDVAAPDVEPSDREWRYRTKLTLALRRTDGDWTIGLHPYDDPAAVFQLVDCPITDERVVAVWREIMTARALLPGADTLRAAVRLIPGGAAVTVEGGTTWSTDEAFFAAVPGALGLWWRPEGGARRLLHRRGDEIAGASFGQVNAAVAERLRLYLLDRVRPYAPRTVVDAYAGTGDTAVALAGEGARVTAIEVDQDAAARCAARLPGGSRVFAGRVEDLIARALPADIVIVNPPRTGLHEKVSTRLQTVSRAPRALIYVSCNPATLARDLQRMPRYGIASLRGFDMFPQTAHVESVCELVPEAA